MRKILLFIVLLTAGFHVRADDAMAKVANLGQMSYDQASSAVDEIANQNNQLIALLAKEINQANFPPDSKTCAIYLLGEYRPKDLRSIKTLVENIDFVASRKELALRIGRWGTYPAQEALVKIGMPAVTVILRSYLPTENNHLRRHLMCGVLRDVLGQNIGIIVLKQTLDKESEPTKQTNLRAALQELEK